MEICPYSRQGKAACRSERAAAPQRRFRGGERLRRRARGRADFPLCLRAGRMHKALFPSLDFLNGGQRHPRGLCRTQSRNGIRRAVSIGAVPCAGRLACRHQCDAAFLRAVPQDPECGTGAVTYAESAGGARRKNYDVPQEEIPHRAYRLRRRGRGK